MLVRAGAWDGFLAREGFFVGGGAGREGGGGGVYWLVRGVLGELGGLTLME